MADTMTLRILRFLPRNLISRAFGAFAAMERPRWFVRRFKRWFAGRFKINLDEAARPIDEYSSLLTFFTRELKPGARTIDESADALVSPVDAAIGAFGRIENGTMLQAKGMSYTVAAFLGEAHAADFLNGWYLTLYLSPRDYHRIHAPCAGKIRTTIYRAGTLWPVNPPAVKNIPALFAVNERATPILESAHQKIAIGMVGATNVGSIRLAYRDFVTNRGGASQDLTHEPPVEIARGQHVGTFELGSTVVLLIAEPSFAFINIAESGTVRVGQKIGEFAARG